MNHRSSIWIVVGLAILPFLVFLPETLGQRTFYISDFQNYFYPYHKATVDLVRSGNLPLWNPYTSGGMPLLGDGQTALFYPPNWLAVFMRPIHALTLATIFSYSLAGVGMFAVGRILRFDRWIGALGALGFMFCGPITAHVIHPWMMATIALVPWLFWAFERMLERPSVGRCAGAAVIVAIQLFAGHPQVPTYAAVAMLVYAIVIAAPKLWQREQRAAALPIVLLAIMYIGGAMLAAIQILPLIELAKFSPRAAGSSFEMFISNSLIGADWLLFLFPYGYGSVGASWMQSLPDVHYRIFGTSWERMAYVGLLPLALAAVGLLDARGLKSSPDDVSRFHFNRFCAIVAVLMVTLGFSSIGGLPIAKLVYSIPVIGQYRANARALGVVAFAINVLALFGANRLVSRARRFDAPVAVVSGLVVLGIAVPLVLANAGSIHGHDDRTRLLWESALKFPNRNAVVPVILAIVTIVALMLPTRRAALKSSLFAFIIAFDLCAFARTYNVTVPAADYDRDIPGAAAFLKRDPEPFRVAIFPGTDMYAPARARPALVVSWTMVYGIEDINTCNSLQPRRCVDWLVSPRHPDVLYALLNSNRIQPPFDRALIPLDVKYAVLQKGFPWNPPASWMKVYEDEFVEIRRNPHPIARATFAEFVKPMDDARAILKETRSSRFDALKVALIDATLSADEARDLWIGSAAPAQVERISYSANQQVWRTRTSAPRLLVLSEMFFPGWRAAFRKSGSSDTWQPLPIYRTNYLFRGIPVPPGDNEVRLIYRPMSVLIGFGVSLFAAIAMIAAVLIARWRGKGAVE